MQKWSNDATSEAQTTASTIDIRKVMDMENCVMQMCHMSSSTSGHTRPELSTTRWRGRDSWDSDRLNAGGCDDSSRANRNGNAHDTDRRCCCLGLTTIAPIGLDFLTSLITERPLSVPRVLCYYRCTNGIDFSSSKIGSSTKTKQRWFVNSSL